MNERDRQLIIEIALVIAAVTIWVILASIGVLP
jgi:hypothetical protein